MARGFGTTTHERRRALDAMLRRQLPREPYPAGAYVSLSPPVPAQPSSPTTDEARGPRARGPAASAPLSSAATPIVDARPPALPTARQLVPRPTGCALGQTGSGRPGSLQSASTWQGHSAWRRSPLPSTEAGNSSLYRQLRLRAYSGRSAPAGVTTIAPIGLRTSTRGPRGTGYPVLKGRGSK